MENHNQIPWLPTEILDMIFNCLVVGESRAETSKLAKKFRTAEDFITRRANSNAAKRYQYFSSDFLKWFIGLRTLPVLYDLVTTVIFATVDLTYGYRMEILLDGPYALRNGITKNIVNYTEALFIPSMATREQVEAIFLLVEKCEKLCRVELDVAWNNTKRSTTQEALWRSTMLLHTIARKNRDCTFYNLKTLNLGTGTKTVMAQFLDTKKKSPAMGKAQLSASVSEKQMGFDQLSSYESDSLVPMQTPLLPMRSLELLDHKWSYSASEQSLIWDFTALQSLSIRNDGLEPFLARVRPETLPLLRQFSHSDQRGFRIAAVLVDELKRLLNVFFEKLQHLEVVKFSVIGYQRIIPISTIIHCKQNLRELHLEDLRRDPLYDVVSIKDLRSLNQFCPCLEVLSIDLPEFKWWFQGKKERHEWDVEEFLCILTGFHSLKRLHLHSHHFLTSVGEIELDFVPLAYADGHINDQLSVLGFRYYQGLQYGNYFTAYRPEDPNSTDPDYDATERIFRSLYRNKEGVAFEQITIKLSHALQPRTFRPPHAADRRTYWFKFQRTRAFRMKSSSLLEMQVQLGNYRIDENSACVEIDKRMRKEEWDFDCGYLF